MNPQNLASLRVWGDFACFTRPGFGLVEKRPNGYEQTTQVLKESLRQ
jgi:hypothetical protein